MGTSEKNWLDQSRRELRDLALHLQSAIESEKTRLSREIHDELGQVLTGLKLDLAWAYRRLLNPEHRTEFHQGLKRLEEISGAIDEAIGEVRRIAVELRPGSLDDLGLAAAIQGELQEFERRTGIACLGRIDGNVDLPDPARTEIFRVFQEIMTNIARHAEATQVEVDLLWEKSYLLLDVMDNGRGITLQNGSHKSLGLIGMRERTALLGGVLEIAGAPSRGTRIRLQVPNEMGGERWSES